MTQKQKSLVGGVSILGAAGLICKVVGVIYRIPLAACIGGEGLGLYSKVFQSYNLLLTVSSAGIPVAISRMVSHYVTLDDQRTAKQIFRVALWALATLGLLASLVMVLLSDQLAASVGAPEINVGYVAIAPSLLLVCVMSAFRGYLQGHRQMLPTAVSQLIEQVGKLAVSLPLAVAGMNAYGPAMGAAGMLLGTSVGEGVALAYMALAYRGRRAEYAALPQCENGESMTNGFVGKRLAVIAIPITLGACIVPLAGWIDGFMVTRLMEADGMSHAEALTRYGLYSSIVLSLINVPTALAMAMSTNLVPHISAGCARKDRAYVARESQTGLRIASVVGFPCAVGMSLLARPIIYLLFMGKRYTPVQLDLAGEILQLSALTIILFTQVQATSGILQGCGKQRIPMYTLAAGVACKIALNYLLIGTPEINIHGAPIASLACYFVSMTPNLYYAKKYAGCSLNMGELLARPLGATALMGVAVWALWRFLFGDAALQSRLWTAVGVALCVAAGVALYAVAAWKLGAIRREDLPARLRRRKA